MVTDQDRTEKARAIVKLLPGKNCGKCGFENCGKFALAAIGGEASPFGCRQDSSTGAAICKILGIEAAERNGVAAGSVERPLGGHGHGRGHGGHHGEGHGLGHHGHHRMQL
jgi:Na+-translocating ferredoxin:NAD+ oxidoreductase RNF subunit RnfB